jgi:hypothetical protein
VSRYVSPGGHNREQMRFEDGSRHTHDTVIQVKFGSGPKSALI